MPYDAHTIASLKAYAREAIGIAGPSPLLTRDGERNPGCRHLAGSPSWLVGWHFWDPELRRAGYGYVGRDGVSHENLRAPTHAEAIVRLEAALVAEGYTLAAPEVSS